jgi:hypothetical protein
MQSHFEGSGDESIEILDVENYRADKMLVFNHQTLVMDILRRVTEAGSHELRTGWFNETLDNHGNIKKVYIEDTRKRFIETVRTAMAVMTCDYDETATANITKVVEKLEKEREKLLKQQWDWFQSLAPIPKKALADKMVKEFFNINFGWYLKYIEMEVEAYRRIATELHSLTKRLDFYQVEDFEA